MSSEKEQGPDLREHVAAILRGHEYKVATDVVLEGRSGACHELGLVGEKFDGLTTFRVVVACLEQGRPIDDDVVCKLASEVADLSASKGIAVSLAGWNVQAAQVAAQTHIELWGPRELATQMGRISHMGRTSLCASQRTRAEVPRQGLAFAVDDEVALRRIERFTRGPRGSVPEEISWLGSLWLPTWSLRLGLMRDEGHLRRIPRVTRVWNSYEALTGRFTYGSLTPLDLVDVDLARGHVRPTLKASKVKELLITNWTNWREDAAYAAKKRHAAALTMMGIPLPAYELAIEDTTLAYHPLWVAFMSRDGQQRLMVLDGVTGREQPGLSRVLADNPQHIYAPHGPLAWSSDL
jgi:hypothetical protein